MNNTERKNVAQSSPPESNKEENSRTNDSWTLSSPKELSKKIAEYSNSWQNTEEGENSRPVGDEYKVSLDDKKYEKIREEFLQAVKKMPGFYIAKAMEAALGSAYGLPTAAPVLWENRKPKQKLFDFIREVYGPWIGEGKGKGLRRAHLRDLDLKLYNTLSTRISRDKNCLPEDLISLEERGGAYTQESLNKIGINEPKDAYRVFSDDRKEADRAYSAAVNHLKR